MRKIIVPLATKKTDKTNIAINLIRETYLEKMRRFDLAPIFVSPLMSRKTVDCLYNECQGALLIGGGDFDAKYYGEKNHPRNDRLEPARDKLELYLLKKILRDRKPFLGICRGCQALAIASGGTLHQHLPDLKLKENHGTRIYAELFAKDNGHEIFIDPKSKTRRILKTVSLKVNSAHHQAVKTTGADFAVSARSKEGIAEIIEHRDTNYFCFGIQCHLEAMRNSKLDRLFAKFAKAIRAGKHPKSVVK